MRRGCRNVNVMKHNKSQRESQTVDRKAHIKNPADILFRIFFYTLQLQSLPVRRSAAATAIVASELQNKPNKPHTLVKKKKTHVSQSSGSVSLPGEDSPPSYWLISR